MSMRLEDYGDSRYHHGKPMILRVGEKEYSITFQHEARCPAVTICTVSGDSLLSRQISACSPQDTFSRTVGRKISLARAIWQAFPRHERKAFWLAYWEEREKRTGKKWVA